MSRTASGSRGGGDDQAKLKKALDELTKLEENKYCADCGCRGPRWASINLGVFICIACSGIHRSLGVHLTFVRSVNLDTWTGEQVAQMQRWGNARAKEYYEANVPSGYRIPNEHSSVREKEMWIRDKYERKRFLGDPPSEKRRHGNRKHADEEEEEEERPRREERSARRNDSGSHARRAETVAKAPAPTADILSFDLLDAPAAPAPAPVPTPAPVPVAVPAPVAAPAPAAAAATQDDWASFGGSSANTGGTTDPFAAQADQHQNKMANIMASFGPTPIASGFPAPNGMMPNAMGMNGMNPMNLNPMNPMGGMPVQQQQQGFMNPGMGQPQPNMMMNPMMRPGMNPGMNPMMQGAGYQQMPMGGMPMNPMMQQQFLQQQQQQQMRPQFPPQMQMQMQPQFQQQQQMQQPQMQQQFQQAPRPQAGGQGLNQPFVSFPM